MFEDDQLVSSQRKLKMKVLILCTGNSCRSQIAEGYLRYLLSQRQNQKAELHKRTDLICSAGVETHGVNPIAVKIMSEDNIDISKHTSNNLNEYLNETFDYIITVCDNAAKHCPVFPGNAVKLHFPFDDPAKAVGTEDEILDEFRRVRDEIKMKMLSWLESLS